MPAPCGGRHIPARPRLNEVEFFVLRFMGFGQARLARGFDADEYLIEIGVVQQAQQFLIPELNPDCGFAPSGNNPIAPIALDEPYGKLKVLAHCYDGQVYRSLSAVAKAVTGSHCSGHFFFGLTEKGPKS